MRQNQSFERQMPLNSRFEQNQKGKLIREILMKIYFVRSLSESDIINRQQLESLLDDLSLYQINASCNNQLKKHIWAQCQKNVMGNVTVENIALTISKMNQDEHILQHNQNKLKQILIGSNGRRKDKLNQNDQYGMDKKLGQNLTFLIRYVIRSFYNRICERKLPSILQIYQFIRTVLSILLIILVKPMSNFWFLLLLCALFIPKKVFGMFKWSIETTKQMLKMIINYFRLKVAQVYSSIKK